MGSLITAGSTEPSALRSLRPGKNSLGVNVGVDLGQKHDYTAIVVMELLDPERTEDPSGRLQGGPTHYVARTIKRLELGLSYRAVAARLSELDAILQANGFCPAFWVDATGVGMPVVDMLRDAGLLLYSVYLTGSDRGVRGERGEWRIGKAAMVSRLQILLEEGRIHLPQTREAGDLIQELLNYEIRIDENAAAQYGVFRTGKHDDLATALGLACWEDLTCGASSIILPPPDPWERYR